MHAFLSQKFHKQQSHALSILFNEFYHFCIVKRQPASVSRCKRAANRAHSENNYVYLKVLPLRRALHGKKWQRRIAKREKRCAYLFGCACGLCMEATIFIIMLGLLLCIKLIVVCLFHRSGASIWPNQSNNM